MKISKDLADAMLMLSSVCLVLIGTTEFEEATVKTVALGGLILLSAGMIALRIRVARKRNKPEHGRTYEYDS